MSQPHANQQPATPVFARIVQKNAGPRCNIQTAIGMVSPANDAGSRATPPSFAEVS